MKDCVEIHRIRVESGCLMSPREHLLYVRGKGKIGGQDIESELSNTSHYEQMLQESPQG